MCDPGPGFPQDPTPGCGGWLLLVGVLTAVVVAVGWCEDWPRAGILGGLALAVFGLGLAWPREWRRRDGPC